MGIVTFGIPQEITIELARLHGASVFIETGTFHGVTTKWASTHFESVHTIERAEYLYNLHCKELAQARSITPHLGDSREILPKILEGIGDQKCVFWLDAHWSGGETAGKNDRCPLLGELACLTSRHDDMILIDDARYFLCAPPVAHKAAQWPTIPEIVSALPKGEKAPFVQIVDDVIFVIPRKDALENSLVEYARRRSQLFWAEFSKSQRENP